MDDWLFDDIAGDVLYAFGKIPEHPIPPLSEMLAALRLRKSYRGYPDPYVGEMDEESVTTAYKKLMIRKALFPIPPTQEQIEASRKREKETRDTDAKAEFAQLQSLKGAVIKQVFKEKAARDREPQPYRIILEDGRTIYVNDLDVVVQ